MTFARLLSRLTPVLLIATLGQTARAQDAADMFVRVNRLEGQIRQLQGQIEQLQFQNRRLDEQLKKFQEDVEFRFQENSGSGQGKANVARPAGAPAQATPQPQPGPSPSRPPPAQQTPQKRGDAFDPNQQPTAPGAPRPLGAGPLAPPLPAGAPVGPRAALPASPPDTIDTIIAEDSDGAPMDDIEQGPLDLATAAKGGGAASPPGAGRLAGLPRSSTGGDVSGGALPPVTGTLPPPSAGGSGGSAASPGSDDYDAAYGLVLQRQYDEAEMAFRQFLQGHPKDKMVPNALYWLGESYLRRSRYEDAAEQYLKVYQSYGQSRVAPDSLVKLASALRGMGQKDQACATLAEVGRKYPSASADVRASVEREQKRTAC